MHSVRCKGSNVGGGERGEGRGREGKGGEGRGREGKGGGGAMGLDVCGISSQRVLFLI